MAYTPIPAGAGGAGGVAIQGSGTNVVSNSTVQFSNSNGITFGLSGSTMTASAAAAGAAPNMSVWALNPTGANGYGFSNMTRMAFWPLNLFRPMPGAMTFNTLGIGVFGATNVTTVDSHSLSVSVGLYQLSNATRISLINSVSWSTGLAASASSYQELYGSSRYITIDSSAWSAAPAVSAGGSYWMGMFIGSAGTPPSTVSLVGVNPNGFVSQFGGPVGASATSKNFLPWLGMYTATTSAVPASVSFGEVICNSANTAGGNGILFHIAAAQGVSWM